MSICSILLFFPLSFGYIKFWIWKGLQRPFSSYLVCGFLTDFLASGITCKHITRNLTCSTYSLFFLNIGSTSSSRAFPALTTCLDTLLWLTDLFLLSCHTLKFWMVPLPIKSQGPARQRGTEKHLFMALELTSNLSNYFHATLIIRPWPFVPCTRAQMDPEK